MKNILIYLIILISIKIFPQTISYTFSDEKDSFDLEKYVDHNFKNVIELDVFRYYDLDSKYDTPLKKKLFSGSASYKSLYDSLFGKKESLLNKWYGLKIPDKETNTEHNFNIRKKEYVFNRFLYYGIIYGIYFGDLEKYFDETEHFSIPMEESVAEKLEYSKKLNIIIDFQIERSLYNYQWQGSSGNYYNEKIVKAKNFIINLYDGKKLIKSIKTF